MTKVSIVCASRAAGQTEELETLLQELESFCTYDPIQGGFVATKARCTWGSNKGEPVGSMAKTGYLVVRVRGKVWLIHRLVWLWHYGTWPLHQIDHLNRKERDNRIENLRDVPDKINKRNKQMSPLNTSGHTGVFYAASRGKWQAQIIINRKTKYLGIFTIKADAIRARQAYIEANPQLGFTQHHGV